MKNTPIDYNVVSQKLKESGIPSVGKATIREIKKLVDQIQTATGDKYIRMEMGIPGLTAAEIAINAEIEALKSGFAAIYPDIWGMPDIKEGNFIDLLSYFLTLMLALRLSTNCWFDDGWLCMLPDH